jgi:hypothetical protein
MANPSPKSRKGIPNRATAVLKDMILGALDDAGGRAYLAQQAQDNPGPFLALIGKVLPKDINANVELGGQVITKVEYLIVDPRD